MGLSKIKYVVLGVDPEPFDGLTAMRDFILSTPQAYRFRDCRLAMRYDEITDEFVTLINFKTIPVVPYEYVRYTKTVGCMHGGVGFLSGYFWQPSYDETISN